MDLYSVSRIIDKYMFRSKIYSFTQHIIIDMPFMEAHTWPLLSYFWDIGGSLQAKIWRKLIIKKKKKKKDSWNTRILRGKSLYRRKTNDIQQRKPISQISSYTDDVQAPHLSGPLFVPSNTLSTFKGPSRELSLTWHQFTIPGLETKWISCSQNQEKLEKTQIYTKLK